MNLLVEKLKQLPQRKDEIWQGGLVRMPVWVANKGEKPCRPWIGGWVSIKTKLVKMSEPEKDKNLEAMLTSLVDFACDAQLAGYRPGGLDVQDAEVAEYLGDLLGEADIVVERRKKLYTFDTMLEEMLEEIDGECDRSPIPNALDNKSVSVEGMRCFAEAVCEFFKAKPWKHLMADDLIEIESPASGVNIRYVSIMGSVGDTLGLSFFHSRQEFELLRCGMWEDFLERDSHWAVLFGPITDLPFGDVDLWEDHGLAVADKDAYPMVICRSPKGKVRRPGGKLLAFVEGLLRALSMTTEDEMDAGRWKKRVETFEGEEEYVLSLVDLMAEEDSDAGVTRKGSLPSPQSMESVMAKITRFLDSQDFENEEAMQEFIAGYAFGNDVPDVPPETPLERAQELIYQAFDATGRRQLKLIREALAIYPDCADAYVLLAKRCDDAEEMKGYYEQGVAAGERALGKARFKNDTGHFWGMIKTRPYMRARLGLANCLEDEGKLAEACAHYCEMLRLNPDDNQGVRDLLLPIFIRLDNDDEAEKLLKRYEEDVASAVWSYGAALLAYRRHGDTPEARRQFEEAVEVNRYFVDYMLGEEEMPLPADDGYRPGSQEEGVNCVLLLEEAWEETEGAMKWLESQIARRG